MSVDATGFTPYGPVDQAGETAGALVILEDALGRVLCQLRDDFHHISVPGYWGPFGGGVEAGETLTEAAIREMAEETGLILTPADLHPFGWVCSGSANRSRLFVFTARRDIAPADLHLQEGAGFAFFTLQQLQDISFVPVLRPLLEGYLAQRSAMETGPGRV